MKRKIAQIVAALTLILWFVPLPTADACGNAMVWARNAKQDLVDAEIALYLGENEKAMKLAERSKDHGTRGMKIDADNIIDIANIRLVLAFPERYNLHAKIVDGYTPLRKMRHAEYLLANNQTQKALKILRRLKREGKMPNRFGSSALSKAEEILGSTTATRQKEVNGRTNLPIDTVDEEGGCSTSSQTKPQKAWLLSYLLLSLAFYRRKKS